MDSLVVVAIDVVDVVDVIFIVAALAVGGHLRHGLNVQLPLPKSLVLFVVPVVVFVGVPTLSTLFAIHATTN